MDDRSATFREVQRIRAWWIWLLLLSTGIGTTGLFGWGMYTQLVKGVPWGDSPLSDTGLLAVGLSTIVLMVALIVLFASARLITEVRSDGLYVRFFPSRWQVYAWDTIASYQVRAYRAVREYGGWGIRWSREGKAYTTGGSEGIQLLFNDGRRLLIGTHRSSELDAAIRAWKR